MATVAVAARADAPRVAKSHAAEVGAGVTTVAAATAAGETVVGATSRPELIRFDSLELIQIESCTLAHWSALLF